MSNYFLETITRYFQSITNSDNPDSLELEVRLGKVLTEPNARFETDLGKEAFTKLLGYYQERGVSVEETTFTEYKHKDARRYRVSESGVVIEAIKKRRRKVTNIYIPDCEYDLRIGLSKEQRIHEEPMYPKGRKLTKTRHLFIIDPLMIQFTIVESDSKGGTSYQVEIELQNHAVQEMKLETLAMEFQVELEKMLSVLCGEIHLTKSTKTSP